ncbi:hypothetical protein NT6N_27200 [Oceaniferula spumae]|uniref:Myosin tail domain-containing protein n=1 Tax=Oceaniferula spumae TaxID=2979115 RepID=A0AAT9FNV2_9BACT
MNSSRYLLARIALAFGIRRKNKRLAEAADELHLLRQAEEILGEDVWEQTEAVEDISVEYWSLRKLQMQVKKLEESIGEADSVLDASHEERNTILNHTTEVCQTLEAQRDELVGESEVLIAKRDEIVGRAQLVKRKFEASKTKISVLSDQDEADLSDDHKEVIAEEKSKLTEYKSTFSKLKKEREAIGEEIAALDEKISAMENELEEDRKRLREEASSAYQNIGKANRDKSKLRAEVSVIEAQMKNHFSEIGRYVSTHAGTEPTCTKICKEHSHLIAQMQSLRSSIALNHKLAAMGDA